ncbi:MAG TPA: 30S ribosomal protein S9 [candidate division Zixibacteria bacterium]|nr:30S ribosomal protein S9 [candidate division Zixibacteria bacterium]
MEQTSITATGRRKEAVASVELKPGKGAFVVNGKQINDYLLRESVINHALAPLGLADMLSHYDVRCRACGGGITGQAGAIRLAVARALIQINPDLRATFRQKGMLTRDPREVERKKYGQPKARKRFQYSKR